MMFRTLVFILALIPLVACSNVDSTSASDEDEWNDGLPLVFRTQIAFDSHIVADSVSVTLLDSFLTDIRTYPMKPADLLYGNNGYETEELEKPNRRPPYVRINLHTSSKDQGKKIKMTFSRYASANEYIPTLNLYTAMAAKTVKRLVLSEHYSLDSATAFAYARMDDFFNISNYNYETGHFTAGDRDLLPYIYSRFFISDSVFYSDFHEIESAIDNGEWGDTLFRVRAADGLMRYYDKNGWVGVRGMDLVAYTSIYPMTNFRENALGLEYCTTDRSGDTITVANRRSEFYDSTLICDYIGDNIMTFRTPYWRRITPEERVYGYCTNGSDALTEKDSTFYLCGKIGWQEVDDMNTVLKSIYKECYRWNQQSICEFRGTPYICQSYLYIDSTYVNMGYTSEATGYAWTSDTAAINSCYPEGIPDTIVKVEYRREP